MRSRMRPPVQLGTGIYAHLQTTLSVKQGHQELSSTHFAACTKLRRHFLLPGGIFLILSE